MVALSNLCLILSNNNLKNPNDISKPILHNIMLRTSLFLLFVVALVSSLSAQTTVLDFEAPATSTTFQYFSSSIDGQLTTTLANPNPDATNGSATVMEFRKPANAQTWAGAFSNPNPTTPVDMTTSTKVSVMVHLDHIGNVGLKLEGAVSGAANWFQTQTTTIVNGWEKLEFDLTLPSEDPPNQVGTGQIYQTVTLFVDFGSSPSMEQISYIDNIVVEPKIVCSTVLDFEAPATSTTFQYFGSTLDPTLSEVVANPDPSGINTSDTVLWFRKPANSQTWAGAFSNPNPTTAVDLTNGGTIKIKVYTDHPGNLALKLENSTTGGPNWVITQPIDSINQWVELSFDPSLPSIDPPNQPATGHVYPTVTLFFDFGTSFPTDQNYYLDDIQVCTSGATPTADVYFNVDMNQYAGAYTNVYVSGTFNNWSGDGNPMTDPDGDKIFSAKVNLPVGLYEYKFTLDNWNAEENLDITSACTNTTFDGPNAFTNRKLVLSEDSTVLGPVCFNSCYGCGQAIKITYNLGMNNITPDPGGVYLAGGAEFGAPNARFRMNDDDNDGVFSISIERPRGYGGFYTFTNGLCPDFSCKENLAGLPCAQVQNFNDRLLAPVQQDTSVNTCIGTCATNTNCTSKTIEQAGEASWFNLRPTLATDQVNVFFNEPVPGNSRIRVFNATGVLVWEQKWSSAPESAQVLMSSWQPGFYILFVEQGERQGVGRFIKQ